MIFRDDRGSRGVSNATRLGRPGQRQEVRARDVQQAACIADESTGRVRPRGASGTDWRDISAKPQARRLISGRRRGVSGLTRGDTEAEVGCKARGPRTHSPARSEDLDEAINRRQVDRLKAPGAAVGTAIANWPADPHRQERSRASIVARNRAAFAECAAAARRLTSLKVAERAPRAASRGRSAAGARRRRLAVLRERGSPRRSPCISHSRSPREGARSGREALRRRAGKEAELEAASRNAGDLQREEALIADAAGVMEGVAA